MKKTNFLLIIIFLLALAVRFWWFPGNIYFGFDQARDAFVSQEIYKNFDFKIVGPSAGKEGLYHGPFWWYLIGPFYLFGQGDPAFPLGFISVLNALGVFLIFLLTKKLFNSTVGVIAALIYAISFSESQYALYFGNPAPAVLSMMLFYLGFILLAFRQNPWGWPLVALGFGLSLQSEFFLIYLSVPALVYLSLFRKEILKNFNFRIFVFGLSVLLLTTLTFLLAEIKFSFRTLKTLFSMSSGVGVGGNLYAKLTHFLSRLGGEVSDNLFSFFPNINHYLAVIFVLMLLYLVFFRRHQESKKIVFLLIWILSNLVLDFLGAPYLYYVNIGVSAGVIILASYFFSLMWRKNKIVFCVLLLIVAVSNLRLITNQNPRGPLDTLYVQDNMFLKDQKKVLDRVYQDAQGRPFVFNALTMPYKVKTTWAYLLNWYGQKQYGYLPFWGGDDVPGFPGTLPASVSLKKPRYAVIEPTRGIPEHLREEFQASENGYSLPIWQEKIGQFLIQKRE